MAHSADPVPSRSSWREEESRRNRSCLKTIAIAVAVIILLIVLFLLLLAWGMGEWLKQKSGIDAIIY